MIIIANGNIPRTPFEISPNSIVIAADGGARTCIKLGIMPHKVIGDFDSLSEDEISILEDAGSEMIQHPVNKNKTDLELALDYAVDKGVTNITLMGLLGERWDMSFANILLLTSNHYEGINFNIVDENNEMFILRGENTLLLNGNPGDTVSVIPLSNPTNGITYSGLDWPLKDASLEFGSTRGISNRLSSKIAQIQLKSGILLVIITHHNIVG